MRLLALGTSHVVLFDGPVPVVELDTGQVCLRFPGLDGGKGLWQPSVNMELWEPPWLACDPVRQRFALGNKETTVVIELGVSDQQPGEGALSSRGG